MTDRIRATVIAGSRNRGNTGVWMCGNVNMRVRDSGGTVSSAGMGVHRCGVATSVHRCGYGDTRCEGTKVGTHSCSVLKSLLESVPEEKRTIE